MNKKIKTFFLVGLLWAAGLAFAMAQEAVPETDEDPFQDVIERDGEGINITADNMKIAQLLTILSKREKVNIISTEELLDTVCVNLYHVSIAQVLDAVLKPKGYDYRLDGGVYVVMKAEAIKSLESPEPPLITRLFRLNYLSLEEAQKFLTPLLSEKGVLVIGEKAATGLTSGAEDSGGDSSTSANAIIIRDSAQVMESVEEALKSLDVRPRQVLVEATILEAILDDSTKLGVDFNALGGIDFADLGATSNLTSVTLGEASGEQLEDTLYSVGTRGFTEDDPEEGFTFGILSDKRGLFIEALENVVDTNVIANPKIIALNRQKAEIIIGGRLGYFGANTISDGLSQQQVEFLETGTQLRFRPFIADDGYIRLEIHPQRSSGVVDPTTGLPSESTSEVTTNILVHDGDTVVIGGLIEEKDSQITKRVPFFGSLPLIGWLFRSDETQTRRTEIIVMITPKILDPAKSDPSAEEDLESFKRRKQLFREGFIFCSRTLYAEKHVEKARSCFQRGHLEWARYHLSRAEALDPHNRDLIPLKDQIEGALEDSAIPSAEKPMEGYLRSQLE